MTDEPEFDPAAILTALVAHGVAFVLIGGMAALVYGSPFLTQDVDVVPEGTPDNWDRLSAALDELGAKIRADGHEHGLPFGHTGQSLAAVGVWNLTTRYGDLDITVMPSGTDGFSDLARTASTRHVLGVDVPVAALADIIRSKQAANRPKDQRVLPTLRDILAQRGL